MSLVERALKRLQQNAAHSGSIAQKRGPSSGAVVIDTRSGDVALPPQRNPQIERSTRIVQLDKDALRAMGLLPPVTIERQIAGQYQQIKRPLIASALGRSETPIENAHLIMMTSALPGEGKTFTSINLALSMARERDFEVVLVDADVAKPHLNELFGLEAERGLLDLLSDRNLHPESVILGTNIPGLSILPAGKERESATELIASERTREVVSLLAGKNGRRIVLLDSPPLLLSTESQALIPSVGQVVLVVRAESTPQSAVKTALDLIDGAKPVSLILNQSSAPPNSGYYGYGTYGKAVPSEPAASNNQ